MVEIHSSMRENELHKRQAGQVLRRDSGQAVLPLVVTLSVILGVIGIVLAGLGFIQTRRVGQGVAVEQAEQAARSGVSDALVRVGRDKDWPATLPNTYTLEVGGAQTTVTVSDLGGDPPQRRIESEGLQGSARYIVQTDVEISEVGSITVLSQKTVTN